MGSRRSRAGLPGSTPPGQPRRPAQARSAVTEPSHPWLPQLSPTPRSGAAPRRDGSSRGSSSARWFDDRRTGGGGSISARAPQRSSPRSVRSGARRDTATGGGGATAAAACPPPTAGLRYPHPPMRRPEQSTHRDGWVQNPRHDTARSLFAAYERSRLPDPTYAAALSPLHPDWYADLRWA